jgi:hypothetical protein
VTQSPYPTIAPPPLYNSSTTSTTTATAIKITNSNNLEAVRVVLEGVAGTDQTSDILLAVGGVTVTIITLVTVGRLEEGDTFLEKNTFSILTVHQVTESQV